MSSSATKTTENNESFDCNGKASDGVRYNSISEFWGEQLQGSSVKNEKADDSKWYSKSETYWATQAASVEGMLGGLGELHTKDILASRRFIKQLGDCITIGKGTRVIDVGAGIGRVTKHLLLPLFEQVDMLEQSVEYLKESNEYIVGPPNPAVHESDFNGGDIGKRIAVGMQDFRAHGTLGKDNIESGSLIGVYDVVWIQWTIGYLTDDDFVTFLTQCIQSLKNHPNAIIILKDNVARSGFLADKEDSSVMRSHQYLIHLFAKAKLTVIKHLRQTDFPKSVLPVRMYALRPIDTDQPSV